MNERYDDPANIDSLGSIQEFSFESRAGEYDIDRHGRSAMSERHDSCPLDEIGVVDEQVEAAALHRDDQTVRFVGLYEQSHVDIGA